MRRNSQGACGELLAQEVCRSLPESILLSRSYWACKGLLSLQAILCNYFGQFFGNNIGLANTIRAQQVADESRSVLIRFGDYLVCYLERFKTEQFSWTACMRSKSDWVDVWKMLEKEDHLQEV